MTDDRVAGVSNSVDVGEDLAKADDSAGEAVTA